MFSLFVALVVIGESLAAPQNPQGDLLFAKDYKGYTYHVYGRANWFMAVEICAANEMRLVRIDNKNKNNEVTSIIDKLVAITGPYWTLGSRLYDGASWSFAVGDPVKYSNWAPLEPNYAGYNEKCIEIYKNGEWNDKDCATEEFVLCERKKI